MDRVSIIVPVFGIERYLPQCIESLISQTYVNIEIILVDDGGKDKCGEICDAYARKDNRIIVVHKQNGGLTSARNAGLAIASGEWISHVDGDDWVDTRFIEKLIAKASDENADIVMSDFFFAFAERNNNHRTYSWHRQGIEGLSEYISTVWTTLWGSLHRRTLYDGNGFRSPENVTYCEDFHLITRLCAVASMVAKVDEPLYFYRQQDSSIMHNLNKKSEADEQWVYLDTICFFKKRGIYEQLKCAMAWRTLKAAQELALDPDTFDDFINYNPDKAPYILSCPFIGIKLKAIMWLISHRLGFAASAIVTLRKIAGR